MSSNAPVNISIVNGPSADRILDALKYAFDQVLRDHVKPWFEIVTTSSSAHPYQTVNAETTRALATVTGVRYESGASGMFILTMNILDGTYEAFYNANTRKGFLSPKQ